MSINKKKESNLVKETKVPFYELEMVRFLIKDGCGLDIAYAYEDLVFSEHGLFILQFEGESSQNLACWFNKDCMETDRLSLFESLLKSADLNGFEIKYKGKFEMSQKGNEQIDIQFIEIQ